MNKCSICKQRFDNTELLQSSQDEYFCKECFKYEYCAGEVSKKEKPIVTNTKCEGDSLAKTKKMFTHAELSIIKQEREMRRNAIFASKRPLQCPHVDCNRYVSICDLNAHFQHEHIEVPIAQTSLDDRNPLTFYPRDIRYGVKQCLILLNVVVPPEEPNDSSQSEKPSSITIAVLASRMAAAQLGEENSQSIVEDEDVNGTVIANNDKIIIWMASNVMCDYSYTVAVSTVSEDIRVKYYGPVLQLGNSTKKLCTEGHCLILSHFHFLGMSENGLRPLQLDVIVHSED